MNLFDWDFTAPTTNQGKRMKLVSHYALSDIVLN